MIMKRKRLLQALSADVLAATALTVATLVAASAQDRSYTVAHVVTVAADEGLPGDGRPPAPGPTNPSQ
jgi:hypothetical protein